MIFEKFFESLPTTSPGPFPNFYIGIFGPKRSFLCVRIWSEERNLECEVYSWPTHSLLFSVPYLRGLTCTHVGECSEKTYVRCFDIIKMIEWWKIVLEQQGYFCHFFYYTRVTPNFRLNFYFFISKIFLNHFWAVETPPCHTPLVAQPIPISRKDCQIVKNAKNISPNLGLFGKIYP